jgi:hypothetical protein
MNIKCQIVVQEEYRKAVVSLTHDSSMQWLHTVNDNPSDYSKEGTDRSGATRML